VAGSRETDADSHAYRDADGHPDADPHAYQDTNSHRYAHT
jgi:hypothetical protein